MRISILSVEDHPVFRDGLSMIIGAQDDMRLVAQAATADEALAAFRRHRPDITLMDLRLGHGDGTDALVAIRAEFPRARVIVLSTSDGDGDITGHGDYEYQARQLFSTILPKAFERMPDLTPGRAAILYPAAWIGDAVASEAERHGFETVRTDGNARYPRGSRLMRWLEDCAVWCCGGWRVGTPRLSKIVVDARRIFAEAVTSDEQRREFRRRLAGVLWGLRDGNLNLHRWLQEIRDEVLQKFTEDCKTLDDDWTILARFLERTGDAADLGGVTLSNSRVSETTAIGSIFRPSTAQRVVSLISWFFSEWITAACHEGVPANPKCWKPVAFSMSGLRVLNGKFT